MTSVVVGTSHTCDLRLPGPYLSPRHFEIYGTPGQARVRDLGSTNGTMVKSALMQPWQRVQNLVSAPLHRGGMVVGGRVLIEVTIDGVVLCKPRLSEYELEDLFLPYT